VDTDARVNSYLGDSLPEIFKEAYDNAASELFHYAFMPGVPMDFINASMRAPWAFIRNTDDRYSVKVVSEESRFLHWAVDDALFEREHTLQRLKAMGFTELEMLRRFMRVLDHAVRATNYDIEGIVSLLNSVIPPLDRGPFSSDKLKRIARAWMEDVHDLCNVSHYVDNLAPEQTHFNRSAREFRRARPWLAQDLGDADCLAYLHPADGTVLFHGLRYALDGNEQILFLANMEGAPCSVVPTALPIPGLPQDGWRLALAAPGVEAEGADRAIRLRDGHGVVFIRTQARGGATE
jgi:hypothetical protein